MEAISIINRFNYRIWVAKKDENGAVISGEVEYLHSFVGDLASSEYREIIFKGNHFDILSTTPGIFRSKEVETRSVQNTEVCKSSGFSVSGIPLNGGGNSQKFDLGTMGIFKSGKSTSTQEILPTVSSNIAITTKSDISNINRDASCMQSKEHTKHSGFILPVSTGILKEVFGGNSQDVPELPEPEIPQKLDDQEVVVANAKETLEKQQVEVEQQEQEKLAKQVQKIERRREITKSWLEQAGLFTDVLKLYEPEASTEKTSEDRRAIMDNHGLVESQAVQQRQSSFIGRVGSLVADFFMPAAYADDEQEQSGGQDASIPIQQIPRKNWSERWKEARSIVEDTNSFNVDNAQPTWILNKSKLLYRNWKEACRTFAQDDIDIDKYLYRAQSTWMFDHSTIAKSRNDFDPGTYVSSNSVDLALFPRQKHITRAYDVAKVGTNDVNVGLTSYATGNCDVNCFDFSNLTPNSNVQCGGVFGINVAHLKIGENFNANVNILSCNADVENALILEPVGANFSGSLQCSTASLNVTVKTDPICVGDNCLQCEGNVSATFGTVGGSVETKSALEVFSGIERPANNNSSFKCKITKKSGPTPNK